MAPRLLINENDAEMPKPTSPTSITTCSCMAHASRAKAARSPVLSQALPQFAVGSGQITSLLASVSWSAKHALPCVGLHGRASHAACYLLYWVELWVMTCLGHSFSPVRKTELSLNLCASWMAQPAQSTQKPASDHSQFSPCQQKEQKGETDQRRVSP